MVSIEGLHLKRANAEAMRRNGRTSSDDLTYEIRWEPMPRAIDDRAPDAGDLTLANQVRARLEALLEPLIADLGLERHADLHAHLDALLSEVRRCVRSLQT